MMVISADELDGVRLAAGVEVAFVGPVDSCTVKVAVPESGRLIVTVVSPAGMDRTTKIVCIDWPEVDETGVSVVPVLNGAPVLAEGLGETADGKGIDCDVLLSMETIWSSRNQTSADSYDP
ncbi:MAG: hypothetical protein Q9160_001202 [Pyrenula sp. 1 TL-2023]